MDGSASSTHDDGTESNMVAGDSERKGVGGHEERNGGDERVAPDGAAADDHRPSTGASPGGDSGAGSEEKATSLTTRLGSKSQRELSRGAGGSGASRARRPSLLETAKSVKQSASQWKQQVGEVRALASKQHEEIGRLQYQSSELQGFLAAIEGAQAVGTPTTPQVDSTQITRLRDEQLALRHQLAAANASLSVAGRERNHFRTLLHDCAGTIDRLTQDVDAANRAARDAQRRALVAERKLAKERRSAGRDASDAARDDRSDASDFGEDDARAQLDALLAGLGVPDVASALSLGSIPALRLRAERAEEELGAMLRLRSELEEDLADTRADLTGIESVANKLKAQVAQLRREKEAAEDEARRAHAEAEEWRLRAHQVERQLNQAQTVIGDMNSALSETQQAMRVQMDDVMGALKATVIVLDERGVKSIDRLVAMAKKASRDQHGYFKTAHSAIKRRVVRYVGEQRPGDEWGVDDDKRFLAHIPHHEYNRLYQSLRQLVVAYDMMPEDAKNSLTTARETIVNSGILVQLAKYLRHRLRAPQLLQKSASGAGASFGTHAAAAVAATKIGRSRKKGGARATSRGAASTPDGDARRSRSSDGAADAHTSPRAPLSSRSDSKASPPSTGRHTAASNSRGRRRAGEARTRPPVRSVSPSPDSSFSPDVVDWKDGSSSPAARGAAMHPYESSASLTAAAKLAAAARSSSRTSPPSLDAHGVSAWGADESDDVT